MKPKNTFRPLALAIKLSLIGLLVVAGLNYQAILDQYALATFQPLPAMQTIEGRLELTPRARAMFYRASPQLDEKTEFNNNCKTQVNELELGCYFHDRIYVLRIDNASLASEMDVVTAHELMHAVWARMSPQERLVLGEELQRVYAQVADDDLKERMAGYARTEPGEEANELHSILSTEFGALSPVLERHYGQYFTDRLVIVEAHAAYQRVFDSRRAELERELAEIRSKKGQLGVLNQQLEIYRANGQIQLYNSLVPRQNQLVDDINKRIAIYHQGVDEYNALSKSLDSQQITDTEVLAQ